MKLINNPLTTIVILLIFLLSGCESFRDAIDTEDINPISVIVKTKSVVSGVDSPEGLEIVFNNYQEGTSYTALLTGEETVVENIIPGIYSINIAGESTDTDGYNFIMKGSLINYALIQDDETIEITINGLRETPIVFKEIFFAGTATNYFRNQFYELYNISDKTVYLDGIYFANLTPSTATTKLPLWPEEDEDNYAYAERVWKFPGSGTSYPLEPGESCIISQFAANHQLPIYNPKSPVDCSSSEFEFNMDNANYPDQPAFDMEHIFYNGQSAKGSVPQYLTSVFGGAYVIFKPLEDEEYDPVKNTNLQTKNLASTSTTLYAKIPITYILDGVEAGHNETMISAKRAPSVIDAGMTYVGATYCSLGVSRKKIGENPDGTPILQDTNNSTDDFDRGVTPMFRRYNTKMPVWNHTLSGN